MSHFKHTLSCPYPEGCQCAAGPLNELYDEAATARREHAIAVGALKAVNAAHAKLEGELRDTRAKLDWSVNESERLSHLYHCALRDLNAEREARKRAEEERDEILSKAETHRKSAVGLVSQLAAAEQKLAQLVEAATGARDALCEYVEAGFPRRIATPHAVILSLTAALARFGEQALRDAATEPGETPEDAEIGRLATAKTAGPVKPLTRKVDGNGGGER